MMRSIGGGSWFAAIALGAITGCAADSGSELDDSLLHDDLIVPIARQLDEATVAKHTAVMTANKLRRSNHDEFYLAFRRSNLEDKWFWEVFQKQTSLFGPMPNTLGTKVVRFKVQNDKLYVFDADDRRATSDVFAPELIIDAYPIVHDDHFESLPGSGGYVLIDPAAGMNQYGALSDYWSGSDLTLSTELSFVQDFHAASDGARYEQVITAYTNYVIDDNPTNDNLSRISSTLGVNIRHYFEGEGFQAVWAPPSEYYFLGDARIIPNTGIIEQDPIHWNFHPGMKPVKWKIGQELVALANDPNFGNGADLVGAVKRGIESWNDALGYKVFEAELASDSDDFADDHVNYFIIDPDPSLGFAYADFRTNPNTGEVRGASVYFSAAFFYPFPDDAAATNALAAPVEPRTHPTLTWQGLRATPLCLLDARDRRPSTGATSLTANEKLERYVQEVAAHEIGHTLGLRHNFKGSLQPPTSSVMDYNFADATFVQPTPGPYDVDALAYLYGASTELPTQPFCTDEDTQTDPNCVRFDDPSPTPLYDYQIPLYTLIVSDITGGLIPNDENTIRRYMGFYGVETLDYVRAGSPSEAGDAWQAALAGIRPPLTPQQRVDPTYVQAADLLTAFVYRDLFVTPDRRDHNHTPVTDPDAMIAITSDAKNILRNLDGARSYATRRLVVDAMKNVQNTQGLETLQDTQAFLISQLPNLHGADLAETQDLVARITAALSPYYQ